MMKAAALRRGDMVVDTFDDPTPAEGQVLVRTVACGICGSDLHAAQNIERMVDYQESVRPDGGNELDPTRDLVMGHEFTVELLEFGPGTQGTLRPGDLFCALPGVVHATGISTVGYSHDYPGGYGELMVLNEAGLLPVPNGLPAEVAALTEPMAVGRHAVNRAELGGDEVILVVGCGPVGLSVIAALKQDGRGPVVACDFSPARRRFAEQFGADVVVDPAETSPYAAWEDLAWPDGVDRSDPFLRLTGPHPAPGVIFECVGVPGVIQQIIDGAMRSTRVVVAGVCMEHDRLLPLSAIGKEVDLRFVLGYTPAEFTSTLHALGEGILDVGSIVTGRIDIDGVPQAFADLADPEAHAKIMVTPGLNRPPG